jgi:ketosteroid isomerase-like protein
MTREETDIFAQGWIAAWNARDLDRVLDHFSEDARFVSPKAATVVGTATLNGKDALRTYWSRGLAQIETLHFTLDHTVWDVERAELLIVYRAEINGRAVRACELMRFGPGHRVVEAEAMYGATLT